MSLATFANRCTTTGGVGTAISIQRAWSWSGFYAWYGSVCLTGAVFLFVFLPETKGKSLEQMYTYFAKITGGEMGAALSASEGGRQEEAGRSTTHWSVPRWLPTPNPRLQLVPIGALWGPPWGAWGALGDNWETSGRRENLTRAQNH